MSPHSPESTNYSNENVLPYESDTRISGLTIVVQNLEGLIHILPEIYKRIPALEKLLQVLDEDTKTEAVIHIQKLYEVRDGKVTPKNYLENLRLSSNPLAKDRLLHQDILHTLDSYLNTYNLHNSHTSADNNLTEAQHEVLSHAELLKQSIAQQICRNIRMLAEEMQQIKGALRLLQKSTTLSDKEKEIVSTFFTEMDAFSLVEHGGLMRAADAHLASIRELIELHGYTLDSTACRINLNDKLLSNKDEEFLVKHEHASVTTEERVNPFGYPSEAEQDFYQQAKKGIKQFVELRGTIVDFFNSNDYKEFVAKVEQLEDEKKAQQCIDATGKLWDAYMHSTIDLLQLNVTESLVEQPWLVDQQVIDSTRSDLEELQSIVQPYNVTIDKRGFKKKKTDEYLSPSDRELYYWIQQIPERIKKAEARERIDVLEKHCAIRATLQEFYQNTWPNIAEQFNAEFAEHPERIPETSFSIIEDFTVENANKYELFKKVERSSRYTQGTVHQSVYHNTNLGILNNQKKKWVLDTTVSLGERTTILFAAVNKLLLEMGQPSLKLQSFATEHIETLLHKHDQEAYQSALVTLGLAKETEPEPELTTVETKRSTLNVPVVVGALTLTVAISVAAILYYPRSSSTTADTAKATAKKDEPKTQPSASTTQPDVTATEPAKPNTTSTAAAKEVFMPEVLIDIETAKDRLNTIRRESNYVDFTMEDVRTNPRTGFLTVRIAGVTANGRTKTIKQAIEIPVLPENRERMLEYRLNLLLECFDSEYETMLAAKKIAQADAIAAAEVQPTKPVEPEVMIAPPVQPDTSIASTLETIEPSSTDIARAEITEPAIELPEMETEEPTAPTIEPSTAIRRSGEDVASAIEPTPIESNAPVRTARADVQPMISSEAGTIAAADLPPSPTLEPVLEPRDVTIERGNVTRNTVVRDALELPVLETKPEISTVLPERRAVEPQMPEIADIAHTAPVRQPLSVPPALEVLPIENDAALAEAKEAERKAANAKRAEQLQMLQARLSTFVQNVRDGAQNVRTYMAERTPAVPNWKAWFKSPIQPAPAPEQFTMPTRQEFAQMTAEQREEVLAKMRALAEKKQ